MHVASALTYSDVGVLSDIASNLSTQIFAALTKSLLIFDT